MSKLTDEQIEQIAAYGEQGKSGQWVARKMEIHPATVCYQMLRAGIDPWKSRKRTDGYRQRGAFTPADDAKLLELSQTMSVKRVAKEMGRAYTSVRIRLMTLEVRAEKQLERAA